MVLTTADVGRRIVLRRRIGVEGGRTVYGDVLGVLEDWTKGTDGASAGGRDDVLTVRRKDGSVESVAWSTVVAGKIVPPPRSPLTGTGLARAVVQSWPALHTRRLGDWLLQSSENFTGRANSALPGTDPGMPLDAALQAVHTFYAEVGQHPVIRATMDDPLEAELAARGWACRGGGRAPWVDFMVGPVAEVLSRLARSGTVPDVPVDLDGPLDDAWVRAYGHSGQVTAAVRHVLGGDGSVPVALARIPDPAVEGGLAGVARATVTGPWLGLAAITVAPERRRRGLASALMSAGISWGAKHGARWIQLQVSGDNVPAKTLYERLGFVTDHRYRYWVPGDAA
ncbi:MAG TPA: GNAT family N-acetyltransferase [Actinopolymorphaceae bacterium]